MATPRQKFEALCDEIDAQVIAKGPLLDFKATASFVEDAFNKAKAKHSFMHDYTISHFFRYITAKQPSEELDIWRQPPPDPKEFWDAAYRYDPWRQHSVAGSTRLKEITHPSRFGIIPLGRLNGKIELGVRPELGALPESEIDVDDLTTLPFARTDSGAISYDENPLEDSERINLIAPGVDETLRRFASLGWVMRKFGDGSWAMTGHVLVMDMDRGRERHPWFVLAHEWPNNDNEGPQGDFKFHAAETVKLGDRSVYGVFPGDRNRTTIAKVTYRGESRRDNTRPFLKQFDENLEFDLLQHGSEEHLIKSGCGPSLAHVMAWYWDENTQEEVCYAKSGNELMRYERETGTYRYPLCDST